MAAKRGSSAVTLVCRGVRGATTVDTDSREAILLATGELLWLMVERNGIVPDDVASAIFTTTPDLAAEYPALAARKLGWHDVALLCGHEMHVPHGLERCIRVLLHWNTSRTAKEVEHIYIRGARNLRPDQQALVDVPEVPVPRFALD
ncbi:MAG TPA: chorismate mutase [Thermoanaerobaculia bacterium]|nr:chorismate mutase [Thermoanaerobaculia bacterium]